MKPTPFRGGSISQGRHTYTPLDAPQVQCNCDMALNREETLSVPGLKTLSNNSEEHLLQPAGGHKAKHMLAHVINKNGKPLMPCKPAKAKHLLKQGKAKIVQHTPFTIQLLWNCEENTQNITLGTDTGYSNIGYSAVTQKRELIAGELKLRKNIKKLLGKRRMYRRERRNRLWYRELRSNNRKKNEGWLAPSLEHKLQSHIRLIEKLKHVLPITKTIIEVAGFNQQKMQNPEITGIEYQQGELQGYEVREYLLEKWGRKCAYCSKMNIPLEVEHIVPKSRGGSDRVSNLTISCHKCNQKKGKQTAEEFGHPEIQKQANETLKATTFMNIVRWKLVNTLGCDWTYGYITKHNRIKLGLDKSHVNDAFAISGTNQTRTKSFIVKQIRRNNRGIQINRKGFKPSIRKQRHKLQPNDLVGVDGKGCRVKGVFNYGKWVRLIDLTGNTFNSNIKNVEVIQYGKGLQFN